MKVYEFRLEKTKSGLWEMFSPEFPGVRACEDHAWDAMNRYAGRLYETTMKGQPDITISVNGMDKMPDIIEWINRRS